MKIRFYKRFLHFLSRKQRPWIFACSCFLSFVSVLLLIWWIAPYFADDPMPEIRLHTPCRIYLDCTGAPIRCERTYDYEWRFPIKLQDMPQHLINTFLAAEDRNFFKHSGVDYASVLRALLQDILNARIVSGASTITMQLAGIPLPRKGNRFVRKFKQAIYARKLERLYSKNIILEEYINRICYGGRIYGIEAAAQYYFGRPAKELNTAEAALLCGLPQKPNRFRPDVNPEAASKRRNTVLRLMVHHKFLTQLEADDIRENQPLRYRDFNQPPEFMLLAGPDELTHYLEHAKRENHELHPDNDDIIQCTINCHTQNYVLDILRNACSQRTNVHDAAAVVLEVKTGDVLAYVSTIDFFNKKGGQVNAASAFRSAGSTLKPFIYAEAIEAGWITEQTILHDVPILYGDYSPGNFDGVWQDRVTAKHALATSLNTPAVQLAARLGLNRMQILSDRLHWHNQQRKNAKIREAGLSFALGTAGNTLDTLVDSYRVFATGGTWTPMHFVKTEHDDHPEFIFQEGTCRMIAEMLRELPLNHSNLSAAWKSGTSSNTCDAWCFSFTPDYVVGVWFGNKDGTPSPELIGAKIAVPATAEIMEYLYHGRMQPIWPSDEDFFVSCKLCNRTGLRATSDCTETVDGISVKGIPLIPCVYCAMHDKLALQILSPQQKEYVTETGAALSLPLIGKTKDGMQNMVQWFVDGIFFDETPETFSFSVGRHMVQAIITSDTGEFATDTIIFSVSPLRK